VTWARLLAGVAATAGLWAAFGQLALHGAARVALLGSGPIATGVALVLCAAGVVGLSGGRQAGARFAGLIVLLLTVVGTLIHVPAIVGTAPGLLLWDLVTRHGWIDNASAQVLMVCALGLFIPLRSGSPRLRDASSAFVAAVLLAGGLARLSGFIGGGLAWDPFAGMPAPVAAGAIALGGALLFVRRGVALLGMDSANLAITERRALWSRIATDLRPNGLDDDAGVTEVGLADLDGALDAILAGGARGRWVVRVAD